MRVLLNYVKLYATPGCSQMLMDQMLYVVKLFIKLQATNGYQELGVWQLKGMRLDSKLCTSLQFLERENQCYVKLN